MKGIYLPGRGSDASGSAMVARVGEIAKEEMDEEEVPDNNEDPFDPVFGSRIATEVDSKRTVTCCCCCC